MQHTANAIVQFISHRAKTTRTFVLGALVFGALAACGGGGDGATGPGAVTRIDVNVGGVMLTTIGGTQTAVATAKDAKGATVTGAVITWTSDNSAIATVSAQGGSATITAINAGATVIRVRAGTIGADVPVQVLGVRNIQINPATASIRQGDSQSYSTTFDADQGVSTAVTWTTGNSAIATVTTAGVVTGVGPGATTVRATSVADSRFSATGNLTVNPARGVVMAPTTADIATGQQFPIVATVNIESGLNTNVTWSTSASAVATVSQSGVVTGVAFGTTTITATSVADVALKGLTVINVVPVVRNVTVSPPAASLFINNTQQVTATVTAESNLPTTVTWRSSNPSVATVSASGLITAVALGSVSITALSTADTTKRASAAITVNARPVVVSIVQRVVGLNPATSTTLTANVAADPGIPTTVTWSSATPSVATITQGGVLSGIAAGTSIITARSTADDAKSDTVTVTVVPRLATSWAASKLNGGLYDDLVSIYSFNPTNAFAVNSINGGESGGDIYRWNGATWTLSASGAAFGTKFKFVHGTSTTNVIAVGTNGKIAKFDGTTWSAMTSGTTQELRGIWLESATVGFAVGTNGTALKLTGSTWAATTSGTANSLNGVWSNAGIAYAVGAGGVGLRYNGTAWVAQTMGTADDLNSVSGVPGGSVTAVGNFGGVFRFDGVSWTIINANGVIDNFYSVSGTAANGGRMYVGGDRGLYQIDGTTLTSAGAPYPVAVFGIALDQSGVVWTAGQRGAIQRFTGGTWETLNFAPDLLDVWTTSATNAWTVAEFGFIYRWNGTTWAKQTSPSLANLYAVWGASSTDAFAGGENGTMLRWNGAVWAPMTFPSTARVYGLWGSSGSNVFAATDIGELLRWNGSTWTLQTTVPGGNTLLSVYGTSANDVYATGTNGVVYRYNGTTWQTFTSPDAVTTLFGVWMSGSNNIKTVGANQSGLNGFGFNFNGTAWQPLNVGNVAALTSVWGASVFDLYATGDVGTMLRFNGVTWSPITTGTLDLLWAVSGAPDASGGAFAVGINSTIVTGSSAGGFAGGAFRSAVVRGSLEPSAAALRDTKRSVGAARGVERKRRSGARRHRG